jgi:hypothetical protein
MDPVYKSATCNLLVQITVSANLNIAVTKQTCTSDKASLKISSLKREK